MFTYTKCVNFHQNKTINGQMINYSSKQFPTPTSLRKIEKQFTILKWTWAIKWWNNKVMFFRNKISYYSMVSACLTIGFKNSFTHDCRCETQYTERYNKVMFFRNKICYHYMMSTYLTIGFKNSFTQIEDMKHNIQRSRCSCSFYVTSVSWSQPILLNPFFG